MGFRRAVRRFARENDRVAPCTLLRSATPRTCVREGQPVRARCMRVGKVWKLNGVLCCAKPCPETWTEW